MEIGGDHIPPESYFLAWFFIKGLLPSYYSKFKKQLYIKKKISTP